MSVEGLRNQTWVSSDVIRMAEILQDIDPTVQLLGIPPAARTKLEDVAKPWAIQLTDPDGQSYIYRKLSEAEMVDNGTITKFLMDRNLWHNESILDVLKAEEFAQELAKAKEREDDNQLLADQLHALGKRMRGTNRTFH